MPGHVQFLRRHNQHNDNHRDHHHHYSNWHINHHRHPDDNDHAIIWCTLSIRCLLRERIAWRMHHTLLRGTSGNGPFHEHIESVYANQPHSHAVLRYRMQQRPWLVLPATHTC